MAQRKDSARWLPEVLCPSPSDLHDLIRECQRLSRAIDGYERYLGGCEATAIQNETARRALTELAESIHALVLFQFREECLEEPEIYGWPDPDGLGLSLSIIWNELQYVRQFFSGIMPDAPTNHGWRYVLVAPTPGLFPEIPIPKKSLLSWCYLPDLPELIARDLQQQGLPNWGHPVWSMSSEQLEEDPDGFQQDVFDFLRTLTPNTPIDDDNEEQIRQLATDLGAATQADLRLLVKRRQTELPTTLFGSTVIDWLDVELPAETFRWPSIHDWTGREPKDGLLGVDFATVNDMISDDVSAITTRVMHEFGEGRELKVPLAEFPRSSTSIEMPDSPDDAFVATFNAPYPITYYQCDPFAKAVEIELATRTRLKEGENPLWFRGVYDNFRSRRGQLGDEISFAEFCWRMFSDRIDILDGSLTGETASEQARQATVSDRKPAEERSTPLNDSEVVNSHDAAPEASPHVSANASALFLGLKIDDRLLWREGFEVPIDFGKKDRERDLVFSLVEARNTGVDDADLIVTTPDYLRATKTRANDTLQALRIEIAAHPRIKGRCLLDEM